MTMITSFLNLKEDDVLSNEIFRDVGVGIRKDYEDHYHIIFEENGLEMMFDNKTTLLKTIFIKDTNAMSDDLCKFIPLGLSFKLTKEDIRAKLGDPYKQGKPGTRSVLGEAPPWDLYKKQNYSINIQYKNDDIHNIELITIMCNK